MGLSLDKITTEFADKNRWKEQIEASKALWRKIGVKPVAVDKVVRQAKNV